MGLVHCGAPQEARTGPRTEHCGKEVRKFLLEFLLMCSRDLFSNNQRTCDSFLA